ncbi:helix-turn-helix domain-containing protein [Nocardia sp. NPDC004860]|uniref:TetR/AcrR family transcriptional regulator n=1 Tax=Nocardia sp. NPDC004860 TaxID=3154557 RepID=UPI00339E077D
MSCPEPPSAARRTRSDAARNDARILSAGDRLLACRGIDFTLDDVAATAEVGDDTPYRRFGNRTELITEIAGGYISRLEEAAATAVRDPDP